MLSFPPSFRFAFDRLPGSRAARLSLLFILAIAVLALGCSRMGGSGGGAGLLNGRPPVKTSGVSSPDRLADGKVPATGTAWNTNRTAIFSSRHAYVDYDLGTETPIGSIAILGDNNDIYRVLGSEDGTNFKTLWDATSVSGAGLRWRTVNRLEKKARYLRVQPQNGDASLSIAEIAVFSEPDVSLPPRLTEVSALESSLVYRSTLVVFATMLILLVGLSFQGASWIWLGILLLGAVWAGNAWVTVFLGEFPFEQREVSLTRAISALLAAAVVARSTLWPRHVRPMPWIQNTVLAFAALLSVASFFNLGHPQFYDHKNREPSVVHNYDMRVYFPVAKYFDELKYDGLYLASVATYAEEHGGLETAEMKRTELRDLRDHRMRAVPAIRDEILAIKSRFRPERWELLKKDMAYFWETMGHGAYLSSMADHGGNATPVWLTIAHFMFKNAPATNEVLIAGGLLDPLLLLLYAVVVWRSFGIIAALVSLVIFGANDFYMFGSNWAGATLRNDWMVYLGMGACALKTNRFKLGGALLAMSALIRAFPAISLIALTVPLAYSLLDEAKRLGRRPTFEEIRAKNKWFIDAVIGAAACVGISVLLSSMVLGFDAWPLWVKKISSFTASPHVNHISLLTMTAGSEGNQALVLRDRLPLHWAIVGSFVVLTLWASYRRPPHVAALFGILLMPIFMYPANYYNHFVFLLALLVGEPSSEGSVRERHTTGKVWLSLLLLCALLYTTVRIDDLTIHFYNSSVLLVFTLAVILVYMLPRAENGEFYFPGELVEMLLGRQKAVAGGGDVDSVVSAERSSEPEATSASSASATEQWASEDKLRAGSEADPVDDKAISVSSGTASEVEAASSLEPEKKTES
jgi:F5/8 type C domain